jgi:hypothetical protein
VKDKVYSGKYTPFKEFGDSMGIAITTNPDNDENEKDISHIYLSIH